MGLVRRSAIASPVLNDKPIRHLKRKLCQKRKSLVWPLWAVASLVVCEPLWPRIFRELAGSDFQILMNVSAISSPMIYRRTISRQIFMNSSRTKLHIEKNSGSRGGCRYHRDIDLVSCGAHTRRRRAWRQTVNRKTPGDGRPGIENGPGRH